MPKPNIYAQRFSRLSVGVNGATRKAATLREELILRIDQPEEIAYDPEYDRFDARDYTLGHETSGTGATSPRVEKINDKIRKTIKTQALYVLREVAKKSGTVEETEKAIEKHAWHLTGDIYRELLSNASRMHGEDGKPLTQAETGEPVFLSEGEIEDIITDSILEEKIGPADAVEGDEDIIDYNKRNLHESTVKAQYEKIAEYTLKETGMTKEALDGYFDGAFNDEKETVNADRLKAGKIRMFKDLMKRYDEKDINEEAIRDAWMDVDIALKGYVCPKHDFIYDDIEHGKLTVEEYRKISYDVLPTSAAVEQSEFTMRSGFVESYQAAYDHLKDVYNTRSLFHKVIDWFKPNGEYHTLSKIAKEIRKCEDEPSEATKEEFASPLEKMENHLEDKNLITNRCAERMLRELEPMLKAVEDKALGKTEEEKTEEKVEEKVEEKTEEKVEEKVEEKTEEQVDNEAFRDALGESAKVDDAPLEEEPAVGQSTQTPVKAPAEQDVPEA